MELKTSHRQFDGHRPGRRARRRWLPATMLTMLTIFTMASASAAPFIPTDDTQVLAELPPGSRHASDAAREISRTRVDVAVPLAQFYVGRARASGDLRYLGYAEATLQPWLAKSPVPASVLVLDATILQSRHQFDASLRELDRALQARPDDAQAWLTRATVLRVLGRYDEALSACAHLPAEAGTALIALCGESVRGLSGHLQSAYTAIASLPPQALPPAALAWRCSELGEMAERLGHDDDARRWLEQGLTLAPDDFYLRAALADLLLRQGHPTDVLELLKGYESMEPMLLRVALAQQQLADPQLSRSTAMLSNAFELEERRGEAVHRREQARFLLDIARQPEAALTAAQENWQVQREPDDALILLRTAQTAHQPDAALPALKFLRQQQMQDIRMDAYR